GRRFVTVYGRENTSRKAESQQACEVGSTAFAELPGDDSRFERRPRERGTVLVHAEPSSRKALKADIRDPARRDFPNQDEDLLGGTPSKEGLRRAREKIGQVVLVPS